MRSLLRFVVFDALPVAVCLLAIAPAECLHAQTKSTPPVLEVKTTPGHVKVFVDGLPRGTTNSAGELRLTRLGRGLHAVRLSREGYRDYAHDLQLEAGQVVPLIVELEKLHPGESASEMGASGAMSSEDASRTFGELGAPYAGQGVLRGLVVRGLTPAARQALRLTPTMKGVVISEVKADSPCGAARLLKNDVIDQINRRPVHSAQEFMRLAADAGSEVVLRVHRHGKTQLVIVSESQ